jgi:tRNA(fMet)-specific endonuclease VapC
VTARYLLDTDTCVFIRQRRPPATLARFATLAPGETALSVITYGELVYGVEKSSSPARNLRTLQELVALVPVLPMPREAGLAYGTIRAVLARDGSLIGANDLWIAAHAMAANLILVTTNQREFKRVAGLTLDNWV